MGSEAATIILGPLKGSMGGSDSYDKDSDKEEMEEEYGKNKTNLLLKC